MNIILFVLGIIVYFGIGLGINEYFLNYKIGFYCDHRDELCVLPFVWPIFLAGVIVYKIIVKVFER